MNDPHISLNSKFDTKTGILSESVDKYFLLKYKTMVLNRKPFANLFFFKKVHSMRKNLRQVSDLHNHSLNTQLQVLKKPIGH